MALGVIWRRRAGGPRRRRGWTRRRTVLLLIPALLVALVPQVWLQADEVARTVPVLRIGPGEDDAARLTDGRVELVSAELVDDDELRDDLEAPADAQLVVVQIAYEATADTACTVDLEATVDGYRSRWDGSLDLGSTCLMTAGERGEAGIQLVLPPGPIEQASVLVGDGGPTWASFPVTLTGP